MNFEKISFCREFLKYKAKLRSRKPIELSEEEKRLFDEEEILSADQWIIANACRSPRLLNISSRDQTILPIHRFCRQGLYPGTFIQRQQINDDQVSWTVKLPDYDPPYYTQSTLLSPGSDRDVEKISSTFIWNDFDVNHNVDRRTANPTGSYPIDGKGYPLNPLGRTGLSGRGELRRWAVNYQTHLIIMMTDNEQKSGKEVFQYLVEKSSETHVYRVPSTWTTGTNMDAIKKTLRTFLLHLYETWNNTSLSSPDQLDEILNHLTFVSTAYIDDARNTDNAWLETSVCCYVQSVVHPTISSNEKFDLKSLFSDRSRNVKSHYLWYPINRTSPLLNSERDVIELIAHRYNAFW